MPIEVYLTFNGNCREAVEFYSKSFNTPLQPIMTFGEAPNFPVPDEAKKLILHTFLIISDTRVMFSDTLPSDPVTFGNNANVTVISNDVNELTTYFNNLKADGTVRMELQETHWSKCYGMLTDKFDVCWQFSHADY